MTYFGKRGDQFLFPSWEEIDSQTRQSFSDEVFALMSLLPEDIKKLWTGDIEINGSTAYGIAHPKSDLDLLIVIPPADAERLWPKLSTRILTGDLKPLADAFEEMSNRLQVRIDWIPSCSAKHLICYSLKEQKLYGREDGVPVKTRVDWNTETKTFEFSPYVEHQ